MIAYGSIVVISMDALYFASVVDFGVAKISSWNQKITIVVIVLKAQALEEIALLLVWIVVFLSGFRLIFINI